jgi:hypothetical protein
VGDEDDETPVYLVGEAGVVEGGTTGYEMRLPS